MTASTSAGREPRCRSMVPSWQTVGAQVRSPCPSPRVSAPGLRRNGGGLRYHRGELAEEGRAGKHERGHGGAGVSARRRGELAAKQRSLTPQRANHRGGGGSGWETGTLVFLSVGRLTGSGFRRGVNIYFILFSFSDIAKPIPGTHYLKTEWFYCYDLLLFTIPAPP